MSQKDGAQERFIYLEDYSDEVMPCRPSLEEWAAWLSKPAPEWNRPEAAKDGATFKAWAQDWLGDVRADLVDGEWVLTPPAPEGTDEFMMRWHEGSAGWDVEHAGNRVEDALDCTEADEAPFYLACIRYAGAFVVTFHAEGPTCTAEAAH